MIYAHAAKVGPGCREVRAGADPRYRLPVRIITELAWHSLFARTMFISKTNETQPHTPEFTIINFPSFQADPQRDGTRSPTFILMDFSQRLVLIGGTVSMERGDGSQPWDEFGTTWVCLDCELMPWSAKAQELLRSQYAAVGSAGRAALPHT